MKTFIATLLNHTYYIDDAELTTYPTPCMCSGFVTSAIGSAPKKIAITVNTKPFEGAHRAVQGDWDTVVVDSIPQSEAEDEGIRYLWNVWDTWLVNNNVTEAYFKIEPA